ncbi:MAG: hypothetical protein CMK65_00215 [Pseudoalteromonas sp.]|jgi:hypothetical protein|uniref:hypothetical protein n=1 Tax=Pseudoalteromonas sp. TaxID=53249 RepID=UPI000C8CF318|nr:hypothetical protein [Pseudoalteromonas sp.]MAD02036.1 hypothetical protein [Pseudoalteromonas sp.]|tara:strand:- start:10653 stop:10985 length:333 start_codon:yes stop_codon:yes gene_type:complete
MSQQIETLLSQLSECQASINLCVKENNFEQLTKLIEKSNHLISLISGTIDVNNEKDKQAFTEILININNYVDEQKEYLTKEMLDLQKELTDIIKTKQNIKSLKIYTNIKN